MNNIIEYGLYAYLGIGMAKSMLTLADVRAAWQKCCVQDVSWSETVTLA